MATPRRAGSRGGSMSAGRSCDGGHRGRAIVGERRARRERGGDHGAAPAARTAREVDAREAAEKRAPVLVAGGAGRGGGEGARARAGGRAPGARGAEGPRRRRWTEGAGGA